MRKHNGMRPQDIVVLLKMCTIQNTNWQFKDLALELNLSGAEITESINRSQLAGLVDHTKRMVTRTNLKEFIFFGLHYVFPQAPGALVNGIPTAHAHPYYAQRISAEFKYVWPAPEGNARGLTVEPLYPGITNIAEKDESLYLLLASVDILRVGRQREISMAKEVIEKKLLHESSY